MPAKTLSKTKTQKTALDRLQRDLQFLTRETWLPRDLSTHIPPEWHTLEEDVQVTEKKVKVTLYLDAPVLRFYRAMGVGYHERINRLLSTWMNMKLAGELDLERALNERNGIDAYIEREAERQLAAEREAKKEEREREIEGWKGWIKK